MKATRSRVGITPEPRLRVDSREELIYLLGEASELEHGLLCEYLYAQFSLKRGVDEGVSAEQLARMQAWEQTIIDIVKQEMLHLALATNVLTALGAAPHFERPNFPILSRWYPSDVQIALLPFGEAALRHFMFLERPEGMSLEDAREFVPRARSSVPDDGPTELTASAEEWHTVGHLYRGIEAGIEHLAHRDGESNLFIGPPQAQVTTAIFEWDELIAVTDVESAHRAIETIVTQGEGARGDWVNSHFGHFVGVIEDYLAVRAADPQFEPARPVTPAFLHEPPDVDDATIIEDPLAREVADLFNSVNEMILQSQARYFMHSGETTDELDTLAKTVKHLMNWVMRWLGPVLTRLPVGTSAPGQTVGPTFEMVRPAFFVLPHHDAAWRILGERFERAARAAHRLSQRSPALPELEGMAANLDGFARDLRAHVSG